MEMVNSTSVASLDSQIDLEDVRKSKYHVKKKNSPFPVVVWKKNKITFLIYKSGRCVILGCRSTQQVCDEAHWLSSTIGCGLKHVEICNLVFSATTCPQNLTQLYETVRSKNKGHFGTYEPELSPAFIYHVKDLKAKVLIFRTGKIIITGISSIVDVMKTLDVIRNDLGLNI